MMDWVSTVRGTGWVSDQHAISPTILTSMFDPSATADGTDAIQVRFLTGEWMFFAAAADLTAYGLYLLFAAWYLRLIATW